MMKYSNNLIETVRKKADLLDLISDYTTLDKKKKGHWAMCPFHEEKTASLHLEPKRGVYYCHGCGAKGDIFTIPMVLNGLAFGEAVHYVAERFNIEISDEVDDERIQAQYQMRRALDIACRYYKKELSSNEKAMKYLGSRGVLVGSIVDWEIGYAPSNDPEFIKTFRDFNLTQHAINAGILSDGQYGLYSTFKGRIVFPIKNKIGKVVAFAGRDITGKSKAKYINGKETSLYQKSQILYGLSNALPHVRENGQIIIVEGYFDAIRVNQTGYKEVVATCGTALTKDMVKSFSRLTKKAICFFDGDKAGNGAAMKALPVLSKYNVDAAIARLPEGRDPADCCDTDEMIVVNAIEDAKPLLDVWLRHLSDSYPSTPNGRQEAAIAIKPVIRLYQGVAKDIVLRQAASVLGTSPEALKSLVSEAPSIIMEEKQERIADPLVLSVARCCIMRPNDLHEIKKSIKLKWIDGKEERSVIRMLVNGTPVHEAARKAAPFLQGELLELAVSDDQQCSIRQTASRLELRYIERSITELSGRERLDAQRKRLKLQWAANH